MFALGHATLNYLKAIITWDEGVSVGVVRVCIVVLGAHPCAHVHTRLTLCGHSITHQSLTSARQRLEHVRTLCNTFTQQGGWWSGLTSMVSKPALPTTEAAEATLIHAEVASGLVRYCLHQSHPCPSIHPTPGWPSLVHIALDGGVCHGLPACWHGHSVKLEDLPSP